MLDFDNKTYAKILELGTRYNLLANCREYPPLSLNKKEINLGDISRILRKKFNNPHFACGLYVHFPFCTSRCSFCKYYSEIAHNKETFDDYLNALEKELQLYRVSFSKIKLDNLCLGGGTPTLLNENQIERYLSIIHRFFRFKPGAQISIEGTPESITLPKIKTYKKLGVNRVSLGLQSINDKVLKKIGRQHSVKDIFRSFNLIRKGGIKYISADILWGLPGESRASYQRTIDSVIKLSPEFVEGFLLTGGGRVKIKRFSPPRMNLDEIINQHKEKFLSNGYRMHCAGNFLGVIKKSAKQIMAVNQNMDGLYNCRSSVLGVGAGASSHFSDLKYKIISDFKAYADRLKNNASPVFYGLKLSPDDYKRQYIISRIGFFRSIEKEKYQGLFKKSLAEHFSEEITHLKKQGVIRETENRYEWLLGSEEMGHEAFFNHVIRYWYHPGYIERLLKILQTQS
jgi:oxygen-independent coproporphyrinogen-3 oxidase